LLSILCQMRKKGSGSANRVLESPTVRGGALVMKVIHQLIDYFVRRGELSADQINRLSERGYWAPTAPFDLRGLDQEIGARLDFYVTGEPNGRLWGTDTYTSDSALGKAAVHAGLLQPGESRVLQVTVEEPLQYYPNSTRNGVASSSWNFWPGAYSLALIA